MGFHEVRRRVYQMLVVLFGLIETPQETERCGQVESRCRIGGLPGDGPFKKSDGGLVTPNVAVDAADGIQREGVGWFERVGAFGGNQRFIGALEFGEKPPEVCDIFRARIQRDGGLDVSHGAGGRAARIFGHAQQEMTVGMAGIARD